MNKGNNLVVLIVTHNRLDYTKRTIDSLLRTVPEAKYVIYDNCSDIDMNRYLNEELMSSIVHSGKKFGSFNIVNNEENNGWGTAVNDALNSMRLGFPQCQCGNLHDFSSDYILISNNDVEYEDGWYDKCIALYEKYPQIGVLGVWKHTAHGVLEDKGDLIVKDQMPAVGWLFTPEHLKEIGDFPQHGACSTKGGNGEDVEYCIRTVQKGLLVAAPKDDVAVHIDGY